MKLVGYGIIGGAIWLYVYQPLAMAVCGGLLAGAIIGYGLARVSGVGQPVAALSGGQAAPERDPAAERLEAMGFRPAEYQAPLAKARASGAPDPVAYVMGVLIR